ncbi:MAG: hypothetical protein ACE363_12525 [Alphaproteobacteria bacterium]
MSSQTQTPIEIAEEEKERLTRQENKTLRFWKVSIPSVLLLIGILIIISNYEMVDVPILRIGYIILSLGCGSGLAVFFFDKIKDREQKIQNAEWKIRIAQITENLNAYRYDGDKTFSDLIEKIEETSKNRDLELRFLDEFLSQSALTTYAEASDGWKLGRHSPETLLPKTNTLRMHLYYLDGKNPLYTLLSDIKENDFSVKMIVADPNSDLFAHRIRRLKGGSLDEHRDRVIKRYNTLIDHGGNVGFDIEIKTIDSEVNMPYALILFDEMVSIVAPFVSDKTLSDSPKFMSRSVGPFWGTANDPVRRLVKTFDSEMGEANDFLSTSRAQSPKDADS